MGQSDVVWAIEVNQREDFEDSPTPKTFWAISFSNFGNFALTLCTIGMGPDPRGLWSASRMTSWSFVSGFFGQRLDHKCLMCMDLRLPIRLRYPRYRVGYRTCYGLARKQN